MITIQNEYLQAAIEPYGAELSGLKNRATQREYIWSGDREVWSGQAPILFPICGRLRSDSFEHEGTRYYLPKHGFARKSAFEVLSAEGDKAQFILRSGEETKRVFPFDFSLLVSFALEKKTLRTTYTVENTGEGIMFFSIGAHPGFVCKIGDKLKFDEYETAATYLFNEDSLRAGEKPVLAHKKSLVITEHIFDDDALFFHNLNSKGVELQTETGSRILRMEFGDAPYLGVWAKPGAPFVCVEPWYGISDTPDVSGVLAEKEGILSLAPSQKFTYSFDIIV